MKPITVQTTINSSIEKVWKMWNEPEHITQWYFASDDWECPTAENDLREGGKFKYRMQAKDGSAGFDMGGIYARVVPQKEISYEFDTRKVHITFETIGHKVKVTETFDPEYENTEEMQHSGWQSILDNFKKHVEANL